MLILYSSPVGRSIMGNAGIAWFNLLAVGNLIFQGNLILWYCRTSLDVTSLDLVNKFLLSGSLRTTLKPHVSFLLNNMFFKAEAGHAHYNLIACFFPILLDSVRAYLIGYKWNRLFRYTVYSDACFSPQVATSLEYPCRDAGTPLEMLKAKYPSGAFKSGKE